VTDPIGPGAFVAEEARAQRLRARGREPEPGIGQRLARPDPAPGHHVDALISNDGSVAEAGAQLLRIIRDTAPVQRESPGSRDRPAELSRTPGVWG
jgi:ribose 1,5-bisphosphokinase